MGRDMAIPPEVDPIKHPNKTASKSSYVQGVYRVKNPDKYVGDLKKVVYRSSWELSMHEFLDSNPNILQWASEEVAIPYIHPGDGRIHKYFPDYWIKYRNKSGEVVQEIVEVKPSNQVAPPRHKKLTRGALFEQKRYAVNDAKWRYATQWCKERGMLFRVITEKNMFGRIGGPRNVR